LNTAARNAAMSGADRLSNLRAEIDEIDERLRELVRRRIALGRKAAEARGGGTDTTRESTILDRCESETERQLFRVLFAASKGQTGVRGPVDDGDRRDPA